MGIGTTRSLRLSISIFRRIGDIITYRRDRALQKEAQAIMETRMEMGLSGNEPDIQDFAITHIKILYSCIQAINEKLTNGSKRPSRSRTPSPKPYGGRVQRARGAIRTFPRALTRGRKLETKGGGADDNENWRSRSRSGSRTQHDESRRKAPPPPKPGRLTKSMELQDRQPKWRKYGDMKKGWNKYAEQKTCDVDRTDSIEAID